MQQRLRFYRHRCIYPLTGRAACYVFHILRPVFGCHKKFIRIKPHAVLLPEMLEQKLVKFDIQFLFAAHFFLNLLKMLLIGSFEIIQQCHHQVSGDFFAEGMACFAELLPDVHKLSLQLFGFCLAQMHHRYGTCRAKLEPVQHVRVDVISLEKTPGENNKTAPEILARFQHLKHRVWRGNDHGMNAAFINCQVNFHLNHSLRADPDQVATPLSARK